MPSTTRKIIIADNQAATRRGFTAFCADLFPEVGAVSVSDRKQLVGALSAAGGKAMVVIDYTLFDLNGPDDLTLLTQRFPDTQWLLVFNELSEEFMRRMASVASVGLLSKESNADEIAAGLTASMSGRQYVCREVAALLATNRRLAETYASPLTATETEILRLIAHGKSAKEIATLRYSSIHTVITHKKNIFRKLKVNTAYEATRYALRAGLIEMVEYYI